VALTGYRRKKMYSDQFEAKIDALIAEYPELTESQVMEAAQNVDSFGYPYEEESDRVLDAYAACLGGTSEQYYGPR
jgi:hypothetical protein